MVAEKIGEKSWRRPWKEETSYWVQNDTHKTPNGFAMLRLFASSAYISGCLNFVVGEDEEVPKYHTICL